MPNALTDVLMITHNRPEYTARSLPALLNACDGQTRVWIWHNGPDEETRAVVRSLSAHPRVHRVHFSDTNDKLWRPTNWMWAASDARYLGKVDDDCLVPPGWSATLRDAHEAVGELGVISCSLFRREDIVDELVNRKLKRFESGHAIMQNLWVPGSGYIMKRECVSGHGVLRAGESFSAYCIRLASHGWLNGLYFPFLFQDHMDDPRSSYTRFRTEEEFHRLRPLTADTFGVRDLTEWADEIKRTAKRIQTASVDVAHHQGWRRQLRRIRGRIERGMRAMRPSRPPSD